MNRWSFLFLPIVIFFESSNAAPETDGIWIDVRTPTEYKKGHGNGATNIPFDHISAEIDKITTNKNAIIMLYCRSGRRSTLAKQALNELGYQNVINRGGIDDVLRRSENRRPLAQGGHPIVRRRCPSFKKSQSYCICRGRPA